MNAKKLKYLYIFYEASGGNIAQELYDDIIVGLSLDSILKLSNDYYSILESRDVYDHENDTLVYLVKVEKTALLNVPVAFLEYEESKS